MEELELYSKFKVYCIEDKKCIGFKVLKIGFNVLL